MTPITTRNPVLIPVAPFVLTLFNRRSQGVPHRQARPGAAHGPYTSGPITQGGLDGVSYGEVDGIEAFYEQCVANGVPILEPLTPTAWGTLDFYLEDPDGYIVCFGGRPAAK